MPSLRIANIATAAPMGAQVYEEQVASRAPAVLPAAWDVRRMTFRSLRSPLPGTHRLPLGRLATSGTTTRRLVGRALHPRGAVLHRMNLEIPPADGEVVTLHDVVSWRFDDESAPVAAAAEELRRAAAVVCVSAFTASEAGNLLGVVDPVVVPNGVDEAFFDAEPLGRDVLAGLGVEGDYVLTGGGASTRKNLAALAAAWPRIRRERPGLTLVLSGPEHARRTELFAGLDGVRLVGRVDATWVPGLVAAAAAVVVPSTYEGFGLPALEAMAAGTPVVAADTSSLPEVVGDGGLLVPPTPDGVVDGVLATLADDTEVRDRVLRGAARSRDFTWQRSAEGHAAVWTRVTSGRS